MLGPAHSYMNELGVSLLGHNTKMFDALMSGDITLSGPALDNFLVEGEQMRVQSFTESRYPSGVPRYVSIPINASFAYGRYFMNENIKIGVGYVESMYKKNFNFWKTSHRIMLGESMMSTERDGR